MTQRNPGGYIHCFSENLSTDDALSLVPELSYRVRATGRGLLSASFTGLYLGRVLFVNGIGYPKTYFDVRVCTMRGCEEITNEETRQKLKARDLKKILVIRDAAYGDTMMITPVLLALRKKYPKALIHFVGRPDTRAVLHHLSFLDGILDTHRHDIGILIPQYDEVFDLVQSIEQNARADYMTALDVAAEICQVDIDPADASPIYVVDAQEAQAARTELQKFGIVPGRDKILLYQGEGTCAARSLPSATSLLIVYWFLQQGWKVVYGGHKKEYAEKILVKNTETGGWMAVAERELEEIKKDPKFQIHDFREKIFFHASRQVDARQNFAFGLFADLIISVDSAWSHVAAALRKKNITIFANYHPHTRMKYYHKSAVVHPDYTQLQCGPCNGLFDRCHLTKGEHPPCTMMIRPEKVILLAQQLIKNEIPIWQEMRDGNVVREPGPADKCPACGSTDHKLETAKGPFLYVRCRHCSTLRQVEPEGGHGLPKLEENTEYFFPARMIDQVEAFEPLGDLTKWTDLVLNPEVKFSSPRAFPRMKEVTELSPGEVENLILMDVLERSTDPLAAIGEYLKKVRVGGLLALLIPLPDYEVFLNTWPPLCHPEMSTRKTFISHQALQDAFRPGEGFLSSQGTLVRSFIGKTYSLLLLRRTDGEGRKDRETLAPSDPGAADAQKCTTKTGAGPSDANPLAGGSAS